MTTLLTDADLEALLMELESDRAERKQAWAGDAPEKARQAVCAFANDLPGHGQPGVLFIGAHDDGRPSNIEVTDRLLQTLSDLRTDGKTVPPPSLFVEKRVLRGVAMAVVSVTPSDSPPVRYEGRIWVRFGPRRGMANAQDERTLNERRRFRDKPFDTHPIAGCPLAELSQSTFETEYLPHAVASDVLQANERTYEQRLASTGMVASMDDPTPTVVGLLTLGKSPRSWVPCAYIQYLRVRGDDRIEIMNPGGPYGTVTQANFGNAGVADYRNPSIAGVLKTLGFVQRFGFGIADARKSLQDNGNPPLEFQVEPTHVMATVRRAP